jgi:hypothetical protein
MLTQISYFLAVTGVGECIAQELANHVVDGTLGRPDRILVAPGVEAPWDAGGAGSQYCSQLALTFAHGPYPSLRFPVEEIENSSDGDCIIGPTAVQVIVSLIRCEYHPPPTNDGKTPPTPGKQTGAALLQCIEEFYMRQAVTCCLVSMFRSGQIDDFRIGASDRQVNGDLGEISLRFTLQIL